MQSECMIFDLADNGFMFADDLRLIFHVPIRLLETQLADFLDLVYKN